VLQYVLSVTAEQKHALQHGQNVKKRNISAKQSSASAKKETYLNKKKM